MDVWFTRSSCAMGVEYRAVSSGVDAWRRDRDAPSEADIYTHLVDRYSADRADSVMIANDTNGVD